MRDMTHVLAQILGKPIQYDDVDDSAAAEQMRKTGMPEYAVHGLMEAFTAMRTGRFAYLTDAVEKVTGHKPRSFENWCREHAGAFA